MLSMIYMIIIVITQQVIKNVIFLCSKMRFLEIFSDVIKLIELIAAGVDAGILISIVRHCIILLQRNKSDTVLLATYLMFMSCEIL